MSDYDGMNVTELREALEDRDREIALLEQPLYDFVENMNDAEQTLYIHHPKCHGGCDYCCGGIFIEKVQRVDQQDRSILYAPRELESTLAGRDKRIAELEAEVERLRCPTAEHQMEITGLTAERDWEQARADRLKDELTTQRESRDKFVTDLDARATAAEGEMGHIHHHTEMQRIQDNIHQPRTFGPIDGCDHKTMYCLGCIQYGAVISSGRPSGDPRL